MIRSLVIVLVCVAAVSAQGSEKIPLLLIDGQNNHDWVATSAEVIATLRAAEVAAQGDAEALAHWDEVIACLSGSGAPDGPAN